jgi:hypothetical protein
MAELNFTVKADIRNGGFRDSIPQELFALTQTAIGAHSQVVSVGTTEEDMPVGEVTTLGWLYIRNLDATNVVKYGPKSAGAMIAFARIKAGEFAWLRLEPGITLRWIADTAAVNVQMKLYQD